MSCDTCGHGKNWRICIFKTDDKSSVKLEIDDLCSDILVRRLSFFILGYLGLIFLFVGLYVLYVTNLVSLFVIGWVISLLSFNLVFISVLGIFINGNFKEVKESIKFHISKKIVTNKSGYIRRYNHLETKYDVISEDMTWIISKWTILFNVVIVIFLFNFIKYVLYVVGIGVVFALLAIFLYFNDIKEYFILKRNKKLLKKTG